MFSQTEVEENSTIGIAHAIQSRLLQGQATGTSTIYAELFPLFYPSLELQILP
ncbi:hypothetical protein Z949_674 [Sulfitobacter guttiformis KCTC 32187]|nr:hypothetical protein Z949_674 [Sulfitobacter guttiformis KCTC 32187]